jgi:hypothetical protein
MMKRLIRFCGANCGDCETYRRFLAGDEAGLVNPENQYRCCWLPKDYPEGRDCEIRICCEERGILYCGECDRFEGCARMKEFYSKPGYGALRERMLEEAAKRTRSSVGLNRERK